jgi:hypothetical protein
LISGVVIVHRRDAENAKGRWIFHSVDPLESEADQQNGKSLMSSGKYNMRIVMNINKLSSKSYRRYLGFVLNFNVPVMRDGIVRIVNELDE